MGAPSQARCGATPNRRTRAASTVVARSELFRLHRLPLLDGLPARLIQMDMGADTFDPCAGDEMMPAACLRVGLGELDPLTAFQLVDDTDVLAIGADHFHVLPDLPAAGHGRLHRCAVRTGPGQGSS